MVKLTLTYVDRKERTSASNKLYISLSIKAREYGDKYLSGFGNKANEGWKAGDEVEVLEVKEVVKADKTYLNFEMPKAVANNGASNAEVIQKLDRIIFLLEASHGPYIAEIHKAVVGDGPKEQGQ